MDYRELIRKYMQHVTLEEGVDFVCGGGGLRASDVEFSQEEKDELMSIHREAWPDCEWCNGE